MKPDLTTYLQDLIRSIPPTLSTPVLWHRGALESRVHHEYPGSDPRTITMELKYLKSFQHYVKFPEYKKPLHVYCIPEAWTPKNQTAFLEQIHLKRKVFAAASAGKAGELYVRSLFLEAGFPYVPRKKRVGEIRKSIGDGEHEIKADLLFNVEIDGEIVRLLVEIKNCREYFCRRSIFNNMRWRAQQLGAQPVLIAAHISPIGKIDCEESGVAFLELGFQVLANLANKRKLHLIHENILAKHEYILINPNRPFKYKNKISSKEQEFIKTISDPLWLIKPHKIWLQNKNKFSIKENREHKIENQSEISQIEKILNTERSPINREQQEKQWLFENYFGNQQNIPYDNTGNNERSSHLSLNDLQLV
jgi:hypothetical protein